MSEGNEQKIPQEHIRQIRELVHDINNALEIIVQTNYLLSMGDLGEDAKQWLKMMETGVNRASTLSNQLREYVLAHSERG